MRLSPDYSTTLLKQTLTLFYIDERVLIRGVNGICWQRERYDRGAAQAYKAEGRTPVRTLGLRPVGVGCPSHTFF